MERIMGRKNGVVRAHVKKSKKFWVKSFVVIKICCNFATVILKTIFLP